MMKKNSKLAKSSPKTIFSLLGSELGWPVGIKPSGDKVADLIALKLIQDAQSVELNYRSLTQWCIDNQMFPQELKNYRNRFECVEQAAQFALSIFGERREQRIGSGQDKDSLAWVLPQYNETWAAERDRRAELKQKIEASKTQPVQVIMKETCAHEDKE